MKVLGPGCSQCNQLEQDVMRAMAETVIVAVNEHITDIKEISRHGI
ncbi:MAG: thioredoxin family protein [Deltaproteobacteria bacterium]|nr:MAG: thioredoxin family protein [Deltaproteobacteria bacterium]